MHLANGAISFECAVFTGGAAAAGLVLCGRAVQRAGLTRENLLLAAGLGCLTFAAQAINVPFGPSFSGHLLGGVLVSRLVGPGLGALTLSLVILVQALLLGDGGMLALGANVLNMAILPALLVQLTKGTSTLPLSYSRVAAVSGLSVVLAALLIVGETAFFRPASALSGWSVFARQMLTTHLWIGALEAVVSVVSVYALDAMARRHVTVRPALVGIAAGVLLLAALLAPISSELPDGYEAAAESSGMSWLLH